MQNTDKPVKQVEYEGYKKYMHPRFGKLYIGIVAGGMPRKTRFLRWFHKRAQDAEGYARAVVARWERVFG